jgi:hypothetical protein
LEDVCLARQNLDVPVASVHADPLPIGNQLRSWGAKGGLLTGEYGCVLRDGMVVGGP